MMRGGAAEEARILIVEDDEDSVEMLTIWLDTMGYEDVRSVTDAAEALTAFDEHRPHVVVIDRRIGNIDGLDLVREMTANTEGEVPSIFVTSGDATEGLEAAAIEAGATEFVLKPYSPRELIGKIEGHLSVRFGKGPPAPG